MMSFKSLASIFTSYLSVLSFVHLIVMTSSTLSLLFLEPTQRLKDWFGMENGHGIHELKLDSLSIGCISLFVTDKMRPQGR